MTHPPCARSNCQPRGASLCQKGCYPNALVFWVVGSWFPSGGGGVDTKSARAGGRRSSPGSRPPAIKGSAPRCLEGAGGGVCTASGARLPQQGNLLETAGDHLLEGKGIEPRLLQFQTPLGLRTRWGTGRHPGHGSLGVPVDGPHPGPDPTSPAPPPRSWCSPPRPPSTQARFPRSAPPCPPPASPPVSGRT